MKNKKIIIIVILVAIIVALIAYSLIGGAIVKNKTAEYLKENKGCSTNLIKSIKVKHSYMNLILSYDEWSISVRFTDEPHVEYGFTKKNGEIIFRGVNDNQSEKEFIKEMEDKYNNNELC